jgi:hypothetical protein
VLALACNSFLAIQRENLQQSMELVTSNYRYPAEHGAGHQQPQVSCRTWSWSPATTGILQNMELVTSNHRYPAEHGAGQQQLRSVSRSTATTGIHQSTNTTTLIYAIKAGISAATGIRLFLQ